MTILQCQPPLYAQPVPRHHGAHRRTPRRVRLRRFAARGLLRAGCRLDVPLTFPAP